MHDRIWSTKLNDYECPKTQDKSYLLAKKFNLFIGVNNSGKSRLLRTLFISDKNELEYSSNETQKTINESIVDGMREYSKLSDFQMTSNGGITPKEMSIFMGNMPFSQTERSSYITKYNTAYRYIAGRVTTNLGRIERELQHKLENEVARNIYRQLDDLTNQHTHFYIPILRGMRPFDKSNDSYLQRTVDDYFVGTFAHPNFRKLNSTDSKRDHEVNVITGLHLYELFTKHLLGKPEQRKAIAKYEELLGKEFFEGKEVTLIPAHDNDTIEIQIGEDPQFPIFHVGDGLQQIIIITSAAYLNTEPSIFFIEEPEQSLHAGLLRQLAKFLIEHTNHQYFITTHSNHLLDLIDHRDQITIHKVSKLRDQEKIQIEEYSDTDRSLLDELGVRPSSVYLANCTIWVEGITDRFYLRFFMKEYVKSLVDPDKKRKFEGFLENYHYAFVEYQGGNLAHWNFDDDDVDNSETDGLCAIRNSASAFLICDGDTKLKPRTPKLQAQLGERFYILPHKEIENILPHDVIVKVAELRFNNMNKKTKEELVFEPISKKGKDYFLKDEGIGRLLDDALKLRKTQRKLFAEDSGTIKDKVKFCNMAIKYMENNPKVWEITSELNELCSKIFAHIASKN
jgi:AAA15 family ATPase/GTPase